MEEYAKGEDIWGMRYDHFTFVCSEYLRGDVAGGSASLEDEILVADPAGQAEIGDDVVFGFVGVDANQNVLEFKVAVDDSFLSEVFKSLGYIFGSFVLLPVGGNAILNCKYWYIFEFLEEGAAFEILHDADEFLLGNEQTFQMADILILQTFQYFCFIYEGILDIFQNTYYLLSAVFRDIILAANFLPSDLRSTKYTLAVAPLPSYFIITYFYEKPSSHNFLLRIYWTMVNCYFFYTENSISGLSLPILMMHILLCS